MPEPNQPFPPGPRKPVPPATATKAATSSKLGPFTVSGEVFAKPVDSRYLNLSFDYVLAIRNEGPAVAPQGTKINWTVTPGSAGTYVLDKDLAVDAIAIVKPYVRIASGATIQAFVQF